MYIIIFFFLSHWLDWRYIGVLWFAPY